MIHITIIHIAFYTIGALSILTLWAFCGLFIMRNKLIKSVILSREWLKLDSNTRYKISNRILRYGPFAARLTKKIEEGTLGL